MLLGVILHTHFKELFIDNSNPSLLVLSFKTETLFSTWLWAPRGLKYTYTKQGHNNDYFQSVNTFFSLLYKYVNSDIRQTEVKDNWLPGILPQAAFLEVTAAYFLLFLILFH